MKTGHRFTIEYITTATVPCLKFTSLVGSVAAGWPCRVHVGACAGRFVDVLHMPVRGVLDVLHLVLTGDRELVKDRGYQCVLPDPGTAVDDKSFYNVVSIGGWLHGMMVPGSSQVPHCIHGMWSVYKQHRGPLFIACDPWISWDCDDMQQAQDGQAQDGQAQDEQQAPEPESSDSGVEDQCDIEDGDQSDMKYDGDTDADEDMNYDGGQSTDSDTDGDEDTDYDEEFVFPLCHSYQLPRLLNIIQLWLDTKAYATQGLLVDCKVPERVTLVPIPTQEDDYRYTGFNSCMHWPALTDDEIKNMTTIVHSVVRL